MTDETFEEALKRGAKRLQSRGLYKLGLADVARQNPGSQVDIKIGDAEEAAAAFCILYKYFESQGVLDKPRTKTATDAKTLQLELKNGSCVVVKAEEEESDVRQESQT